MSLNEQQQSITSDEDRARACEKRSRSLWRRYQAEGQITLIDEAIVLERQALALRPPGHPKRAASCGNLAVALKTRYKHSGDAALLEEAIALEREALALWPSSSPKRALSCGSLAASLWHRYAQTGDAGLIDEAIALERAALATYPDGHPHRARACANLASSLTARYAQAGDDALLDEAIALEREALALCPAGHPDRALTCGNLATSLRQRYDRTGTTALLDEMVALYREALGLRTAGHPGRGLACMNLGQGLVMRYKQTGDPAVLGEAITLQRESLGLYPDGHEHRASCCANLAGSLRLRYDHTDDVAFLDEAITLDREALALRPAGHPSRAMSCGNLAAALWRRYKCTSNSSLPIEIVALAREALALYPEGHLNHAVACGNVAAALLVCYEDAGDVALLDEALVLLNTAVSSSPSVVWSPLSGLCRLHLQPGTPHFSIKAALELMLKLSHMYFDTPAVLAESVAVSLEMLWSLHDKWCSDVASTATLATIYSNFIDKLPHITGFALSPSSQLAVMKSVGLTGLDGCVVALLAGQPAQAIELLDHAHGLVWAQALRQRDPQIQDLPLKFASELQTLLRAPAADFVMPSEAGFSTRYLTGPDVRHEQNSRIQSLLGEVRATPGLERFMLGSTFAQLREVAREHPVVLLVAARGYVYALVVSAPGQAEPRALPLVITSERLSALRDAAGQAGLRNGQAGEGAETDPRLVLYKSSVGSKTPDAFGVLADLWRHIVQPVFDHLQLQVCAYYDYVRSPVLISSLSRRRAAQDHVYTGVLRATLRSSRCMQPASTTGQATEKYAALTMSSPRTLRHCLRCSGHRIRPRRLLLPASTSSPSPKTAAHPARCRVCGTLHRK
jgi:tetratricopeptide (TPR) repeat protein